MAGMLPGVECARRRRLHQSRDSTCTSGQVSTRRSSFCLYTSNHEYSSLSSSSSLQRGNLGQAHMDDQKLGGVAREAKERLDEKLRAQWKSETKRKNSQESLNGINSSRSMVPGDFQTKVVGLKKSGSKRFSWGKIGWKASDQDECAICLEQFSTGETLAHLRCAHRFHSRCLVPWLKSNAHCPCCRMST